MDNKNIPLHLSIDKDEIEVVMLWVDRYISLAYKGLNGSSEGESIGKEGKIRLHNNLISIYGKIPVNTETIQIAFPTYDLYDDIYDFKYEVYELVLSPIWLPDFAIKEIDKEDREKDSLIIAKVVDRLDASIELAKISEKEAENHIAKGDKPNGCVLHQHVGNFYVYYQVIALSNLLFESNHYTLGRKDSEIRAKQDCEKYARDHKLEINREVKLKLFDYD